MHCLCVALHIVIVLPTIGIAIVVAFSIAIAIFEEKNIFFSHFGAPIIFSPNVERIDMVS